MTIKSTVNACLAALLLSAAPAFAESLSWQYIDVSYLQPSNGDTRGFSGEFSGHINDYWVLKGGANRIERKDSSVDLEMSQMRYDVAIGRVFSFTEAVGALVSLGYTHIDYSTEILDFEQDEDLDAANLEFTLRGRFARQLEGEAGLGLLVDDKDTSDVLWNLGLRWWPADMVSVGIGANGTDSFDGDDILYEIGFRFDLR